MLVLTAVSGLVGCGGGETAPSTPAKVIRLIPTSSTVKVLGEVQLTATDTKGQPIEATFEVVETGAGSVDATGRFMASATPGTFHVRARTTGGATAESTVTVEGFGASLHRQGDLLYPRVSHTASLLSDGSVLVVGGIDSSVAERFIPGSLSFESAGDTGQRRWSHTATILPGGGILIVGGLGFDTTQNAVKTLDAAALYQSGAFTKLNARMASQRYDHRAAALSDGRVLIAGGLPLSGSDISALTTCEVFDPVQKQFSPTGTLSVPRAGHTATPLMDGRVLVVGGRDSTCLFQCSPTAWRSAEIYDPATGTFTPAGAMAQARFDHTATLLPNGKVIIAGGTTPDLPNADISSLVEVYDPSTNQFQTVGTMLRPRSNHTATLLGDGRVLLAGGMTYGHGENTIATATVEAFDPVTGQSQLAVSGVTTRYHHAAVRLSSGEVLLVGGTEGGGSIRLVERFD